MIRPLTIDERIVLGNVGETRGRFPESKKEPDDLIHRFLSGKASRVERRNLVRLLLRLHAQPSASRRAR